MPGKYKILLGLAAFLAISVFSARPSLAVDDCACPAGGCLPGGTGQGAFQNAYSNGLGVAGQNMANNYNLGAQQVIRLDVQNHYGLANIQGIFKFAITEYQAVAKAAGAGTPDVYIVDEVVDDVITNLLTAVFSTYLTPALTTAFGFEQSMLCKPMPSANISQLPNNIKTLMLNPNCNAISALGIPFGTLTAGSGTIYQLKWGQ